MTVKRTLSAVSAAALFAIALFAIAPGPFTPGAQAASTPASLRAYACSPALQPLLRGLSVTAVMRPVTGTQRLRMRFELLRATRRGGRYRAVTGPNLGRWISPPNPAIGTHAGDVWEVTHPVVGVQRAGYYRLQIAFEWVGPSGRRLGAATRTTPACALLELRPDLLVSRIAAPAPVLGRPGKDAYVAAIRNRGVTAAGPFAVRLSVAGGAPVSQTVGGLAAHGGARVRFVAPACAPGDAITVTVDPAVQVLDYDPNNNSLTVVCPGAG